MTDLLQEIEVVCSDFRTKYGFLTRVINKAYNYLYNDETINKVEVLSILNTTKNWLANFVNQDTEDKYSVFSSLIECLHEALDKEDKTILDNYIKEYFYKTILNKYYTKNITDEEFSKLEIGELFRAFPKVYETLNGSSFINFSKSEDYIKIRFISVAPVANNKKRLKFHINDVDSSIKNLLNKINTEVNESKKQELKRKLKYEIDNKYTFITPFPNPNIKNPSSGLYNFHTEEMRVIDIEMSNGKTLNGNIFLIAEGEQEYNNETIYVEQGSFLKVNNLKKRLMDNIVGGSLSSSLVNFRGIGKTNIIKNPNTSYDAEEFSTLFDDRDIKVAKKLVIGNDFYEPVVYSCGDKIKIYAPWSAGDKNDSFYDSNVKRIEKQKYIFNNYKNYKRVVAKLNGEIISSSTYMRVEYENDPVTIDKNLPFTVPQRALVIKISGTPLDYYNSVDELIFINPSNANYIL